MNNGLVGFFRENGFGAGFSLILSLSGIVCVMVGLGFRGASAPNAVLIVVGVILMLLSVVGLIAFATVAKKKRASHEDCGDTLSEKNGLSEIPATEK